MAGRPVLAPRFPVLDTMRAVGALAVLTTHATFWSGDYLGNGWLGTLWARLDVGVALFFVLSGFLLSRPWFARREAGLPPPGVRRYLRKRFLRIYPAYAVVAVISLAVLADNRGAPARQWLSTLLLADIYVDTRLPAGLTQMWSLATEVAFYLLLPLAMAVVVGRGRGPWRPAPTGWLLIGACALSVWWLLDGAWRGSLADRAMPLQWLPSYLPWFAAGIAMALVHVLAERPSPPSGVRRAHRALTVLAQHPGACWVATVGILMVAATPLAGPALLATPTGGQLLTKVLLYAVCAVLLVAPAIFGDPASRYATLMGARPLRHLGIVSYSLFCVHLPVLHLVMWWRGFELFAGNGPQIWSLTLVGSLVAAELLYRAVERPALRLGAGLGAEATPRRVPTTASTTS